MGTHAVGAGPRPDPQTPAAFRICDYVLGGDLNVPADRNAARRLLSTTPHLTLDLRANQAFCGNAVRYLLGQGIQQILELGSGLPAGGAVHTIAHASHPTTRIVSIDHDPIVVAHTRDVLGDAPHVNVLHADLRSPVGVLDSATVLALLDLTKPVGLLASAVPRFLPHDDELAGVMAVYRSATSRRHPPGRGTRRRMALDRPTAATRRPGTRPARRRRLPTLNDPPLHPSDTGIASS